jgi:hypothetical protein
MTSQHHDGTVYLTEQETERIRNTIKERIQKGSELTGHAREPRDSKAAISQASGASLMADMGSIALTPTQGTTLPALAVGQPYPPCIVPLRELRTMRLSALRLETHHRGYQLAVNRVSPVVTLSTRSWAMVQDEVGETERLEIALHKTRNGKDVLESSSSFVLKDPYFIHPHRGRRTNPASRPPLRHRRPLPAPRYASLKPTTLPKPKPQPSPTNRKAMPPSNKAISLSPTTITPPP